MGRINRALPIDQRMPPGPAASNAFIQRVAESLKCRHIAAATPGKLDAVDFDGSHMTVRYGVSGSVDGGIERSDIPNYSDDPVAFTVLVHRVPGGPEMEVYADFQQPPYRLYRVRTDMDELLHHAMTLFLRARNILED